MRAYIYTVCMGRKMLKTFCVNVHLSLQCGGLFGMRVVASGVLFFSTPIPIEGCLGDSFTKVFHLLTSFSCKKKNITHFPSRR